MYHQGKWLPNCMQASIYLVWQARPCSSLDSLHEGEKEEGLARQTNNH